MKIAVLSGKGGTGKTTISASLAYSVKNSQYVDCDVEEPNGNIFLKASLTEEEIVTVKVPVVDKEKCTGCGDCARACQFNAIAVVNKEVLIFNEICHSCGACVLACKEGAMYEVERPLGVVQSNSAGTFMQGKLNVGEIIAVPVVSALREKMNSYNNVILDSAPGAACVVVSTIEDCDFCILVTEPTPFGLHDLQIAVSLVNKLKMPYGVIVNKAMDSDQTIQEYCAKNNIKVLMEVPYSKEIARNYSKGVLPVQASEEWKKKFKELFNDIKRSVQS